MSACLAPGEALISPAGLAREGGSAMGTLDARSPREPAKVTIGCRLPAGKVAAVRAAADADGKTLSMWLHELIDAKLEALNNKRGVAQNE